MSKILVLNAGSSSLKYKIIDPSTEEVFCSGICERIGEQVGSITHKANGKKFVDAVTMETHQTALSYVLKSIVDQKSGKACISSLDEIDAVGHRVLHGGEKFTKATKIEGDVLAEIEDLVPLGPLHQPANIQGIVACSKLMPRTPQVAVFDTAFHATLPEKAYRYAIPYEDYKKHGIRKYGFHGTSHKYISEVVSKVLVGMGVSHPKLVIAHIGNGASISAVNDGKCVDTTMGMTPLDGCVMGTRSGSVDPSIVPILAKAHNLSADDVVNKYLNKKSGWLGLTGVSDARDIDEMVENKAGKYTAKQQADAQLAVEIRAYNDAKFIGSYLMALQGADAIVFTAGIGEHDALYREAVCGYLGWLDTKIDSKANNDRNHPWNVPISTPESKIKVFVVPTDEELSIARQTVEELGL